ncbi:MAG: hypothetical protein HYS87_03540 [Candidatus Colwellbacteria bacterium]|nr:hypothetical protein [Candidatus Colwellbacteria bacterium]
MTRKNSPLGKEWNAMLRARDQADAALAKLEKSMRNNPKKAFEILRRQFPRIDHILRKERVALDNWKTPTSMVIEASSLKSSNPLGEQP